MKVFETWYEFNNPNPIPNFYNPIPESWEQLVIDKSYPLINREGKMLTLLNTTNIILFKVEAPRSLIKALKDWKIELATIRSKGLKKGETGRYYYEYEVIFRRNGNNRVLRNA